MQQTKLHRPSRTVGLLQRPRLLTMLDAASHSTLTLIVSSPGSGKSSLVNQWLDERGIVAAWLQLDSGDSDPARYLTYVVYALRSIAPDFGAETLLLLRSTRLPPLELITTTLSNELHELGSATPFLLVLDDYHLVQNPDIDRVMASLAARPPQGFHVLIMTRQAPSWPLGRLRIEKRLCVIGAAELRFTQEETAAYLMMNEITLPDTAMVSRLQRQTEGWATGLQLAVLALRQQADVSPLLGSQPMFVGSDNRYLMEYMVDEVLAHLPERTVQFMLATSICDRFCAPLCQQLTGLTSSAVDELLRYLNDANLFLIPLEVGRPSAQDGHFAWYRYHHLMHQSLAGRLEESFGREEMASLRRNAAAWLGEHGYLDEALGHLLAIADWDAAARLLVAELDTLLDREDRRAIDHWLTILPDAEIARRPGLLLLRGWDSFFNIDLPLLVTTLREIQALTAHAGNEAAGAIDLHRWRRQEGEVEGHIAFLYCAVEYFSGKSEGAVREAQRTLQLVPQSSSMVYSNACVLLGSAMQMLGHYAEAEELLRSRYQSQRPKPTQASARLLFGLAMVHLHSGQYARAVEVATLLLREASSASLPILEGWAHDILGRVHYERNDLERAAAHFTAVTDRRYVVNRGCAYDGFTGRMLVAAALGDEDALVRAGEEWRVFEESLWGLLGPLYHSARARSELLLGHTGAALRWARAFTAPLSGAPMLWAEFSHITKVRCLLAAGTQEEMAAALALADACNVHAENMHMNWVYPALNGLRALLLARTGARKQAIDLLTNALHASMGEGFVRSYVDLGPAIVDLLRDVRDETLTGYVAHILAALPGRSELTAAAYSQILSGPAATLTERECEVLMLLATPLTPHGIAAQLSVSYSTIRHHTAHIYEKLGVNKRRQAVLVATELGLLS